MGLDELRRGEVLLRPVIDEDFDAVAAMLREPEVARWWGPFDEDAIRRDLIASNTTLVIEVDGTFAGILLVDEERDPDYRHVGFDISLATEHQGRGLGRAVLRLAIDHFAGAGHHRFTIDPAVGNDPAIRCYTAVGFRPVGVLRRCERDHEGRWRDNLLMDLLVEDRER